MDQPAYAAQQPATHRVLKDVFGFDAFRPGQEPVIDALVEGRHVLAVMPTGAGKSLCFQVPALVRGGLAVVVSPLVALMQDQVAALRLAGVEAEAINSSRDRADNVASWRRVTAGRTRLLYMAPERLMTERMLAALSGLPLGLIAVDEAHCISQWGPAFRPEYEDLSRLREVFPGVPIGAFTATADAVTRDDIVAKLFGGRAQSFVTGFDRPNIALEVVPKRDGKRQLLAVVERHKGASGIVYCLSRRQTEETAAMLTAAGFKALPYHAGMDKADRAAHQDAFLTEPGVIVVATIAFGMGIDKPDVRFVVHTDLPGSLEAYYQEIGRAGRDGAPAEACLLYGLDAVRMRRRFVDEEDSDEARKQREHRRLDALIGYCETPECRRRTLLRYFGEEHGPCGNCDACLNPAEMVDGTVEAQQALSAVVRTGQRYGAAHIVDVLRGTRTDKAAQAGHDALPTFGAGKAHTKDAWRSILRQLVAADLLSQDIKGYGGLSVTEAGRAVLRGEAGFRYRKEAERRGSASARPASAKPGSETPAPADAALLDRLKALRLKLAKERAVPAYVIFSDRSLQDMARRRPRTRDAFARIHGVGAAKLEDLAEPFLEAIAGED
jgi:ATP-dependent DNA helicase RecQ